MLQTLVARAIQPCETYETTQWVDRNLRSCGWLSSTVESVYRRLCANPEKVVNHLCPLRYQEVHKRVNTGQNYAGNVFLRIAREQIVIPICEPGMMTIQTACNTDAQPVASISLGADHDDVKELAAEIARFWQVEIALPISRRNKVVGFKKPRPAGHSYRPRTPEERAEEISKNAIWKAQYEADTTKGLAAQKFHERTPAQIRQDYDERKSERMKQLRHRACRFIQTSGFRFDTDKFDNWDDCVVEPDFWLRLIRKLVRVKKEQFLREIGKTNRNAGCYVSDSTYTAWLSDQRASRASLSLMEAVNDLGDRFSLNELAKKGVSNPEVRRAELMVRLKGMEDWAESDAREWIPMFYTITCPSKYHIYLSKGAMNPRYNGATPSEARDYLQANWENARKRLHEKGIEYYGAKFVEPHHDGCPHWHMILFVPREHESTLTEQLRLMAFKEDGDEPGAKKARFKALQIDQEVGSTVGYLAKYVAKNIDGFGLDTDHESGADAKSSAGRVTAWASTWGIRQFQQIGGPPVTPWREMRRLKKEDILKLDAEIQEIIKDAHGAADTGDWAAYIQAMGGAACRRSERPIGTWMAEVLTQDKSRLRKAVRGLKILASGEHVLTRLREWVITKVGRLSDITAIAAAPVYG